MDPVSIVIGALAAGAAAGAQDTASASVKDGYLALKEMLKNRLKGRRAAEAALERHERAPEAWRSALEYELSEAGVCSEQDVLNSAVQLLNQLRAADSGGGDIYSVDARKSSHFQIGRGNVQMDSSRRPPRERREAAGDEPHESGR
jgi:hypothetical protein